VIHNSGEIEWFTPPPILDAARSVMCGIDCDPASCPDANRNVRASVYFTQKTDGLTKRWGRRVWLNPPYKKGLVKDFINALLARLKAGEVCQACVIVNNATETRWFQALLAECAGACFLCGRVKFIDKHGRCPGMGIQGQAVLYFGSRVDAFRRVFSCLGTVMTRG
jgi:ParB family chromosome partitioning protein